MNELAEAIVAEIKAEAKPSESIQEIFERSIIPQGVEIPKPEEIFALDGIPIFTKKSISTLIGKAKSGKTTCMAWVVSQLIHGDIRVLWIDTEQGEYYGSRTQFWVLGIAQLIESKNLIYVDLREEETKVRADAVAYGIEAVKPDLVILDGVRDLIYDINDQTEATTTSGRLMQLASRNDCHIISILHQNKNNDHARGHIGSEMINKSETVIKVSKENGITICEPEFTRGEPFAPFAFDRDTYGRPVLVNYKPQVTTGDGSRKKLLPVDVDRATHLEMLNIAFGKEIDLSYSDLMSAIAAAFELYGNEMGITKAKKFIQYYIQQGFVEKSDKTSNKTFYHIKK